MTDPLTQQLLDPNCPWTTWKLLRIPHIKWCEAQVCSWIQEPANTWSNLGFIFVGLLLLATRHRMRSSAMRFFGVAAIAVGITSFAWHASNIFFLQILDFTGMYVFLGLLLFINLDRLRFLQFSVPAYLTFVIALTAITVFVDGTRFPIQAIVFGLMVTIVATEIRARVRAATPPTLFWFVLTFLTLIVAAVFSMADHRRLFCDPSNHWIQGHAIWHVLSAIGLFTASLHYRQFDRELARPRGVDHPLDSV